jgi:hypothetical protein
MAGMFRAYRPLILDSCELKRLLTQFYRRALYRQIRLLAKKRDAANGFASGLVGFSASSQVPVTNPGRSGQSYIDFFRMRFDGNPEIHELLDRVQLFFDATGRIPTVTELEVFTDNIEVQL